MILFTNSYIRPTISVAWHDEVNPQNDDQISRSGEYMTNGKILLHQNKTSDDGLVKTFTIVFSNLEALAEYRHDQLLQPFFRRTKQYNKSVGIERQPPKIEYIE